MMQVMRSAVNTDERSLTHPPLTSCCVALFLTGQGTHGSMTQGLGTTGLGNLSHTLCLMTLGRQRTMGRIPQA